MPVELLDKEGDPKLSIPLSSGHVIEPLSQIVRMEADSNYSKVFFESRSPVYSARTLSVFERLLRKMRFRRVHHSHLVHLEKIKKFDESQNALEMTDGAQVPVSRRKKGELDDWAKGS